jgi:cytochrome c peroxidase
MIRTRHLAAFVLLGALAACADAPTASRAPLPTLMAQLSTPDPADQVALGRLIFFDMNLSANSNQSCASCHAPAAGWTGPTSSVNAHGAVYEGSIAGRFGDRKPPSSAYATPSPILHFDAADGLFIGGNFWDGRATGERLGNPAAEQALGPFLNPAEQALDAPSDVIARICAGSYGDLFRAAYGSAACDAAFTSEAYDAVGMAIAAFEGSPESNAFTSKYDAYLAGRARLTPEEHLGLALFKGKGRCAACHVIENGRRGGALFTDFTFDNLGVPRNPENPFSVANPTWRDPGLGGFLSSRSDYASLADENMGKHKVPTLRNVDLRPGNDPAFVKAYGHNGYFKSLWGIVHFYNTRDVLPRCMGDYTEAQALTANCWPAAEVAANVNVSELGNLRLTRMQENAIVAFLRTLSDGYPQ